LVQEGDLLVALPSSGVHSNGYSLVRKIFFDKLGMSLDDDFEGKPLKETLLTPTNIYIKTFKKLKENIVALAHITGGGIVENLPRVLPSHLDAHIQKSSIKTLPIFDFMSHHVEEDEMYRTFNMGVGMILVVRPENLDKVLENSDGYLIGEIVKGSQKAIMK